MSHTTGPCGWDVTICETCCTDAVTGLPEGQWDTIQDWAVDFLWRATGKRYGLCERTYRPCRRSCLTSLGPSWGTPFVPFLSSGSWVNLSCGSCPGECSCNGITSEVYLPNTHAVTGVTIDGAALVPADVVRVYDHSRLIRADGSLWPECQDLSLPSDPVSGVAGTWEITVLAGLPVPAGGAIAAGILACEFAKRCIDDDTCRLPKRIQTLSRNGVTIGFQDMFEGLADLRTEIWEIDAFLEAARTTQWREPSIGSPDVPDAPELTWPVL